MTGGGSGGHITPILAVAHTIKQRHADSTIVYVGQRGDPLLDVPSADKNIDRVCTVRAGKLRRYSGEGWRQLLDLKTQLLNIRDILFTLWGLGQSLRLLRNERPDVLFCKGGFVGVPVGLAAAILRIPYITHDSDVVPGLANRIIARWASHHAVGMPANLYPYPQSKTTMVGIPVSASYQPVDGQAMNRQRTELKIEKYKNVILVTGGGNGAEPLNRAIIANSKRLLREYPGLLLVHITGRRHEHTAKKAYNRQLESGASRQRVHVMGFSSELHSWSAAADVVVARGGATNLAEFAIQRKACLIVPSKQLGWNVKNATVLQDCGAAVVLTDDEVAPPSRKLGDMLSVLLDDKTRRDELGASLGRLARPHAARDLAELIMGIATSSGTNKVHQKQSSGNEGSHGEVA